MMKKAFLLSALFLMSLTTGAQTRDPNNKYLVWTNNIIFNKEEKSDTVKEEVPEEEKAKSFIERYFRYVSMCDWQEGMRFMVIPSKEDMVIRTFSDSLDHMVSSMSLRNKIMVYKGRVKEDRLHERIRFQCLEDGKSYYFELPTLNFEDYCASKYGVPTLAYLGDVDTAIDQLVGKQLVTRHPIYNVDISTTSYGYEKIEVPLGTEVTVVAAGVGTRNYPVKLIVADRSGKEFFQNVAISRTNSGMRDNEFVGDELKHTFEGSFELLGDQAILDRKYDDFVGRKVFTLYRTEMTDTLGNKKMFERLSNFVIKKMHVIKGTPFVRMTLLNDGVEYQKQVSFQSTNVAGEIGGMREDFYYTLFASGNLGDVKGVRKENLHDIRNAVVRVGFNEQEVKLALGNPDATGTTAKGMYTWTYLSGTPCTIYFDKNTKMVKYLKR